MAAQSRAGTGRLSNVGRNFAYVTFRRPYYVDMVLRARREDKRLSLVEHQACAVWVPVEWVDEWRLQHRGDVK